MKEKVQKAAKSKEKELKIQLQHLEEEIAKSEAVSNVYEMDLPTHHMHTTRSPIANKDNISLQHKYKEKHSRSREPETRDLSSAILQLANLQSAPSPTLDVFSGDPLDYAYFRTAFKGVVERAVLDERGRLTRFLSYTAGAVQPYV